MVAMLGFGKTEPEKGEAIFIGEKAPFSQADCAGR
jgi:hypothetical protein